MTRTVDVLLATYNSGPYLRELLQSLERQSWTDFTVLVRDDGSVDGTVEMLDALVREQPKRFHRIDKAGARLGTLGSFSRLLEAAEAPYVMFCDHDDVWLPDKIEQTLSTMRSAVREHGEDTPVLVFTDLRIVGEALQPICESYWRHQRMDPRRLALEQQLSQNVPCGCTMMLNRPLVDLCYPMPSKAVMHDHWVSLAAAAMGRFAYVDRALILYRQHDENVTGACGGRLDQWVARARQGLPALRERFYRNVDQAKVFLTRYRQKLSPEQVRLLEAFATLREQGFLERRWTLLHHRILKCGLARNVASMVIV
ncbi:MAG: glycosyltransferase family 2 protein [Phycisphaerae bacterium]|nr:glycosyltransferase family 2 protein [Phycisphaerae bacterium]